MSEPRILTPEEVEIIEHAAHKGCLLGARDTLRLIGDLRGVESERDDANWRADQALASLRRVEGERDEARRLLVPTQSSLYRCIGGYDDLGQRYESLRAERDSTRARADRAEAEVARLRRREPGREEMLTALGEQEETFYDGWTVRRCRHCGTPVAGGPTACVRCAETEALRAEVARLTAMVERYREEAQP
jgi:rubrerythrin